MTQRRVQLVLARVLLASGAFGCSTPAHPPLSAGLTATPSEPPAAVPLEPASSGSPLVAPTATPNTPPASPLCSPDTAPAALAPTEFARIHAGPVLSAAVGTPPRAALWSGSTVTLFDGAEPRDLPTPPVPAGATVELFFGRDNQPRLMGFSTSDPGELGKEIPVYLRFRHGAFRREPSELGPLAAPLGALYGVLGFADPEVVCRPHELCLVKRTNGWGRVAAHDRPVRIVLRNGSVFALHPDHIDRLGASAWSPLEPARNFEHPVDAWVAPNGELWVADSSATGLVRLRDGKRWEPVTSPITEPRAIFGRSDRSVFVVGKNGAAEFDGAEFRCIRGVNGPLQLAFAVGDAVWLAGTSGAYRASR